MPRPRKPEPLHLKIVAACKAIGKLQKRGKNERDGYNYLRASDVFEAFRSELFSRGVLCLPNEDMPEFVAIHTNGGELIECRQGITFTLTDGLEKLAPLKCYGVGRDARDKAIYKAKSGAGKYFLKMLGLVATDDDDPEFNQDGDQPTETIDDVAPLRSPKTVTARQISAFEDACAVNGKTADEVSGYLLTEHKVSTIAELGRGKAFTRAIVWASDGKGTLDSPKPQAAPAQQPNLPLARPQEPIEMRINNQKVTFEPKGRATFSV